ncbi:MAG: hypothetical protein UHE86_01540, partial [Acutalibacteraceae bacterium]|nr:hypothetical protein [Acutalibacteraceae bacterium]
RVGPLEEQSKKAQKFLEYADTKRELEIGIWMHTLNNSKDAIRNQDSKIAVCEAQYGEVDALLSQYETDIEANSMNSANITSTIDQLRTSSAHFEEQAAVLSGEIAVLQNTIVHNNETVERIEREIENIAVNDAAALTEIEDKKAEIANKKERITELELKASETSEELNSLLSDSEGISKSIEELSLKINALSAQGSDFRVMMVTAQSSIDEITNRLTGLDAVISEKTEEVSKLSSELDETNALLDNIEETINSCTNSLKGYELRFTSRKEGVESAKAKLDEIRLDIESKKHKIETLEDLEKNMEGFNYSVKKVVSESKNGMLKGIYGPVSRIISVDSEYSVAIEVALGNAMQNIVVESDADAKRAIAMLKSGNHGRATFLPVATIKAKKYDTDGTENMFGFVGIASELVSCDAKYKEIIKYLLSGTVVADDIDSATSIAKKTGYKLKVVSLDGQVVNPGGSLTGGSLSKQAGLLSRSGEIEKLKATIEKLTQKETEAEAFYNNAVADLASVEADIVNAKAELTTANEDKIRTLGELKRISELKLAAESSYNSALNEKETSGEKIKEYTAVVEKSLADIEKIDADKAKVQSEIDSMSGGRDTLSAKREQITNMLTEYRLNIVEIEKDIENLTSTCTQLEQSIGNRTEQTGLLNAEKDGLISKNTEIEQQIVTIEGNIEGLKNEKTAAEAKIEALINERNEMEKGSHEMRVKEREAAQKRETLGGELARLNERRESMLRELDDVVKRLYDEYQLTRSEAEEMGIVIENLADAKRNLAEIKSKIRSLGNVNVAAIE